MLLIFVAFTVFNILAGYGSVGDYSAAVEDYPYTVSIEDDNSSAICTGTILSPWSVLVSGYCVHLTGFQGESILVRAGSNTTGRGGNTRRSNKILTYRDDGFRHNIGMLCLSMPLSFNGSCQPISLLSQTGKALPEGLKGTVVGWGDSITGYPRKIRRATNATIVDQRRCEYYYVHFDRSQEICARGSDRRDELLCDGDDGAPLVVGGILAGIANQHSRVCSGQSPDSYYNVSYFGDWIQNASSQCEPQ